MNFVILPNLVHPILIIRRSGRPAVIVSFFLFLFSLIFFLSLFIITNSRDGTAARGGLGCRLEAWVSLPPSILRTISALQGETSPRTEHLSSRAAAQSKLGVTDCEERKRKGRGDDLAPDSLPPRFHLHQHHHHHRLLLLLLHLLSPIWISGLWGRRYAAQGEPQPLSKTQITRAGSAARIRYCSDAARRRDCACKYLSGCLILRVCGVSARSVRLGGGLRDARSWHGAFIIRTLFLKIYLFIF